MTKRAGWAFLFITCAACGGRDDAGSEQQASTVFSGCAVQSAAGPLPCVIPSAPIPGAPAVAGVRHWSAETASSYAGFRVEFASPEPDASYEVSTTPAGSSGGSPNAGALQVRGTFKATWGFVVGLVEPPGGAVTQTYDVTVSGLRNGG